MASLCIPLLALGEPTQDVSAPDGVRKGGTLSKTFEAPPLANVRSSMRRPTRNYPEQPPMIPHTIRGYQVDTNFNQCLSCHSRSATEVSGAPMVSITHFVDRDGQTLASVSPRRYFCVQCHVPQHDVDPVKVSTFKGIDQVLEDIIKRGE
ncbi:MAG: cytochrome C [Marinimicrobium sp.]|nr:cytochrome C [Marinimicrobium sp.]